jgi:hypothetical protein
MGGLKFKPSISVLMWVTIPELLPTMLFAPSMVTNKVLSNLSEDFSEFHTVNLVKD